MCCYCTAMKATADRFVFLTHTQADAWLTGSAAVAITASGCRPAAETGAGLGREVPTPRGCIYVVIACIVLVCIGMPCVCMTYIVMACMVIA